MTGGQATLDLSAATPATAARARTASAESERRGPLRVIRASDDELHAHDERLRAIDAASEGACIWLRLDDV
jgi:DNA polymerase-3 subunit epsilon